MAMTEPDDFLYIALSSFSMAAVSTLGQLDPDDREYCRNRTARLAEQVTFTLSGERGDEQP